MSRMARAEIVALDKRFVWHPYTPMDRYVAEVDPLVIERSLGARLFDVDGRGYLDANSSWWTASLGHRHPRLVAALKKQLDSLDHCALAGMTHEGAARLAEEIVAIAPRGLEHVFFSDDGSTAVEVALKLTVQHHRQRGNPERSRFVTLSGAFHGETIGCASIGGVQLFRAPFAPLLFDTLVVPSPADEGAFESAFSALREHVHREAASIAAIVLEPLVQGAAGMQIYAPGYLKAARALADEVGCLLVADEVFTGYGRTGTFWACDQAAVAPDVLCTAKGFSGGMLPMAATLTTSHVFDSFRGPAENAFYYGHSFCGNPLGAAVAREVLAIYREENVMAGVPERHAKIRACFERLGQLPTCSRARSVGMIGAVDVGGGGYLAQAGWKVYEEARQRGAYLRPMGEVVYVCPPINIPMADLDELLHIVEESVRAVVAR